MTFARNCTYFVFSNPINFRLTIIFVQIDCDLLFTMTMSAGVDQNGEEQCADRATQQS